MATKDFIYEGLGFPVLLKQVETYISRGEELPKVNHNKLNNLIFDHLLKSRFQLTGNQLNFIRGHMNLSQVEFAKKLGYESHSTVSSWLNKGNDASGMPPQSELAVRMLMAHFVNYFKDVNDNALQILSESEPPQAEISIAA